MWYNKKTGDLQSEKPGKTIIDEMYWKDVYGDWREVEFSFVPPPKETSVDSNISVGVEKRASANLDGGNARSVYMPFQIHDGGGAADV